MIQQSLFWLFFVSLAAGGGNQSILEERYWHPVQRLPDFEAGVQLLGLYEVTAFRRSSNDSEKAIELACPNKPQKPRPAVRDRDLAGEVCNQPVWLVRKGDDLLLIRGQRPGNYSEQTDFYSMLIRGVPDHYRDGVKKVGCKWRWDPQDGVPVFSSNFCRLKRIFKEESISIEKAEADRLAERWPVIHEALNDEKREYFFAHYSMTPSEVSHYAVWDEESFDELNTVRTHWLASFPKVTDSEKAPRTFDVLKRYFFNRISDQYTFRRVMGMEFGDSAL